MIVRTWRGQAKAAFDGQAFEAFRVELVQRWRADNASAASSPSQ
jgi:hypothetical protein